MSVLNDLKKIFFGATSIAKSAAEKTGDFVAEEGAELLNKSKEALEKTGDTILDKSGDLMDTVKDTAGSILETGKDKFQDISDGLSENPMVKKAGDGLESLGETVLDKGKEFGTKFGELSEDVGEKVLEKGSVLMDKGKDISESIGEKVLEAKDKLVDKAEEVGDKISDKYQETLAKAQEFEKQEALKPKGEFAEKDLDASGSLLEGTDDFFSKADKYADGDYGTFSEGKITVQEIETEKIDKTPSSLAGFEDLDNDGDDLIDDALILEDPKS